ncbi:GFA family protein [Sphingomonas endophytica]|uniref:GFA family protein n=1 Tax=Sphingomonas endophytica TaxID=869719 RepID=UPI0040682B34
MTVTPRCHCGAIRYTAGGAAEHHALCHCPDCRPWSGTPRWSAGSRSTTMGHGKRHCSRLCLARHGVRAFCGACGTGLF